MISRRKFVGSALAMAALGRRAQAATGRIKFGVLNDMSGPYANEMGPGSVICARLAAEEFSQKYGVVAELVSADHQNKPDIGGFLIYALLIVLVIWRGEGLFARRARA